MGVLEFVAALTSSADADLVCMGPFAFPLSDFLRRRGRVPLGKNLEKRRWSSMSSLFLSPGSSEASLRLGPTLRRFGTQPVILFDSRFMLLFDVLLLWVPDDPNSCLVSEVLRGEFPLESLFQERGAGYKCLSEGGYLSCARLLS